MNIHHRPMFDTKKVVEHYTEKDGVPIKYVCTTALNSGTVCKDVFFRKTPHPEFGNRYFGLSYCGPQVLIGNADKVEELDFDMVQVDDQWHYSQHRHDYYTVGDVSIDGGRAYLKMVGELSHPTKTFRIKDGEFIENSHV